MEAAPRTAEVSRALARMRELCGDAHVQGDAPALDAAATATFATRARPSAIVRPASRDEVQGCIAIARAHGIVLHAISRGRNWGLGSRVPTSDGAVLLDLSRMNRIVAFDEEM